jgi:hypothetical protein
LPLHRGFAACGIEILRAKRSFEPQNRENLNRKKLQIREEISEKTRIANLYWKKLGRKNSTGV